jgi:hypothetical protein
VSQTELPFPPARADRDEWNPYFVAYAASEGTTPERIPAGAAANCRFTIWMRAQWDAWLAETGIDRRFRFRHAAEFEAWLFQRHGVQEAP